MDGAPRHYCQQYLLGSYLLRRLLALVPRGDAADEETPRPTFGFMILRGCDSEAPAEIQPIDDDLNAN